ncbi:MAG: hypothetical protein K2X39_07460, partial [Silvanigrellaceae bacterium]|nr:hypothetical protein [Silvanigrellaceae bacterium]
YPNPDHPPTSLEISMLGAGAKSENLASIWVLKHLLDKLTYDQFLDLLVALKFAGSGVTEASTVSKLESKFNVSAQDIYQIKAGILEEKKREFASDIAIIDNPQLKVFLKTLHYGFNFAKEEERLEKLESTTNSNKLVAIQLNLLKNNLSRWQSVAKEAEEKMKRLEDIVNNVSPAVESDREFFSSFALSNDGKNLIYKSNTPWKPHLTTKLLQPIDVQPPILLTDLIKYIKNNSSLLDYDNLLLDGVVPYHLIFDLLDSVEEQFEKIKNQTPLQKLFWNDDFKYSLGIYYLAKMVESNGVRGSLDWVPSFPLGVNAISLAELALSYQTILEGQIYRYFKSDPNNQILLIKRVEDSNGNLLWEAQAESTQLIDKFYSLPILNILRATVTAGTASTLNQSIILRSQTPSVDAQLLKAKIKVPNFGKTGTTNDYIDGTYVGFLPYPPYKESELNIDHSFTIASYVGYDSNEPMTRKGYKVYGGSGAIPAWNEVALAIIKEINYAQKLNYTTMIEKNISEVPLKVSSDALTLPVSIHTGLPLKSISSVGDFAEGMTDVSSASIYSNDYSHLSRTSVRVSLIGKTVEGDIFIPNRKVSFFKEIVNNEQNNKNKNDDFSIPESPFHKKENR